MFWTTIRDWNDNKKKWLNCKWDKLDGIEVEKEVANYKIQFNKCKKVFRTSKDTEVLNKIIENFVSYIVAFEKFIPIASNLRVDGMEPRHWELLSEKVNFKVNPYTGNFNLSKLIDLEL